MDKTPLIFSLSLIVTVSCTTINIPVSPNPPTGSRESPAEKKVPPRKTEPEVYGHLIHLKGLKMDTCDMRLILRLLNSAKAQLDQTSPVPETRLDSIKKVISKVYNDFDRQSSARGPNQIIVVDEEELEKRLMVFIDLVFSPDFRKRKFYPKWLEEWFHFW